MKNVISIFCLPYEIDDLKLTINQLKNSYVYLKNPKDWHLHVTMCVADDMTDWDNSDMPKGYFVDKFDHIMDNCKFSNASWSSDFDNIKGCVSQRRWTLEKYHDANYFIWLDTDIIFGTDTLAYIEHSIMSTYEKFPYSIITPEIVRVWDNTWDCLVNENFKNEPLNYQKTNDPYIDCGTKGTVVLESVNSNVISQPRYKFAGGWFTCISGELLRELGVPKSLGHYGLEDTYIMHGAEKLMRLNRIAIHQFKIKNLVVCENYKYRNNSYITNHLKVIDRRDEFKKIAFDNVNIELAKIK